MCIRDRNHITKRIFDWTNPDSDSDSVNVLGMRACTSVHNKLSCTRLQKIHDSVPNMAALTKFIAKNNKTTTSASKT